MILAALDEVGGVGYLTQQADKKPAAFMALLGRVLPTQVAGDPNSQPLVVKIVRFGDNA
jgi:hypothetical protein